MPSRTDDSDDDFLFRQRSTGRLGEVRFHHWGPAFDHFEDVPNVAGSGNRSMDSASC
ncbi:hypothetical protein [Streptomyces lavendulae]|uniref:hypothetical protein n=1 Tax=Streptomyces lavendulae TaxID=1914 RepID=UPI0036E09A27